MAECGAHSHQAGPYPPVSIEDHYTTMTKTLTPDPLVAASNVRVRTMLIECGINYRPIPVPEYNARPDVVYATDADAARWGEFIKQFPSQETLMIRPLVGEFDYLEALMKARGWTCNVSPSLIEEEERQGFEGVIAARWPGDETPFDFDVVATLAMRAQSIDIFFFDVFSGERWRFLYENGKAYIRTGFPYWITDDPEDDIK